jgi:hypothetical protein
MSGGLGMIIARIIAVAACGFALGCCSMPDLAPSYPLAPKLDAFQMKPGTVPLAVESNPPGAEARSPEGVTCRTPCTLELPVIMEPFVVTYALTGYAPQSVAVRPVMPAITEHGVPFYLPNPAVVQLTPVPVEPPKPVKPTPPKKQRPVASAPAPAATTAQAPPPFPQSSFPAPLPPPPMAFPPAR